MKLSLTRYSLILILELFFLLSDLLLNCISEFFKDRKTLTFLFFLQDSFLLLLLATSLIYVLISYYQVELTERLYKNFQVPIFVVIIYILLSILYHLASIHSEEYSLQKVSTVLLFLQKLCECFLLIRVLSNTNFSLPPSILVCPINFYLLKRSILMVSHSNYGDKEK